MLSLWKLRVGAEAYYLDQVARGLDDYYSGAGEAQGHWMGTGAAALELTDTVDGDDLRAILAGLNPGTGLTPNGDQLRTWKGRVPGFDLTFSAPKSVSVVYALGDPLVRGEVTAAIDEAIGQALGWLEREACFVRRGSNNRRSRTPAFEPWGTRRLAGVGFIAAGFRHRTSRAGDPHLHSHVLIANLTRGPDRRWTALDAQAIYRSKIAAGTVFQTVLRNELSQRLGVEWGPICDGIGDIAGIPRQVIRSFSKRHSEIEDELERTGGGGKRAEDAALLATRRKKPDVDHDTLDAMWEAEAAGIGYGPDDINQLLTNSRPLDAVEPLEAGSLITVRDADRDTGEVIEYVVTIDDFVARIAYDLPASDATVTRHDIHTAVAARLVRNGQLQLVERLTDAVLAHPELVPLPIVDSADAGWEQRWTTRRLLRLEDDLDRMFAPHPTPAHALAPHVVAAVLAGFDRPLGADQADTVTRIATQALAVEVVVGRAGTGKTYTMNAVRNVFEAAGWRTVGVAVAARAARELTDGAGIESTTVPRFVTGPAHRLDRCTLVVIDEAAMMSTVDLHTVLGAAWRAGSKVVLVGDHHQLPEIAAGGGFAAAIDAVGDQICELTINRRQRHRWEQTALAELRLGDVAAAWQAYVDHDRVHLADTPSEVHAAAVADWWQAYQGGANAQILAGTRREARTLNRLARAHAAAAGRLIGPVLDVGGTQLQAGDRVVLLRNADGQTDVDTGRRCRVDNGMIGNLTHINPDTGTATIALTNGRRIALSAGYLAAGYVAYGYAATIHKTQGATCDDIFVVGPAGLYREASYVALSRARNTAHLYATSRDAAIIGERSHSTGIALPGEQTDPEHDLLGTLSRSQAKSFASRQADHLAAISDLAHQHSLAELNARLDHVNRQRQVVFDDGYDDPAIERAALERAIAHRGRMHVGGRVNALDWDNVGVIEHLHDSHGTATVAFTTSDGNRTSIRTLDWKQLRPIDHPEPANLTDDAEACFLQRRQQWVELNQIWIDELGAAGVGIDDHIIVAGAIEQRSRQLTHQLRATPPEWLRYWLGGRPDNPTAATVYDDEIRNLAIWRDTHHLSADTPGYGPPPDHPTTQADWEVHMDRTLRTREWLTDPATRIDPTPHQPFDIATCRQRLDELDRLLATAPADQRHIVDRILDSNLDEGELAVALRAATDIQQARRDWILEHWPHVIEHHQLTAIHNAHPPLDRWPTTLPEPVQHALDQIAETVVDHADTRTLVELDAELHAASPAAERDRLYTELNPLHQQYRQLRRARADRPNDTQIVAHLARVDDRIDMIRARIDDLDTHQTLWDWNSNPAPHIQAQIDRRIEHLTHRATTNREPWIESLAATWHINHPQQSPDHLHDLVANVAAWRERHGHTGPDPLGPPPAPNTPGYDTYQHLAERIAPPRTPRIEIPN